MVTKVCTNCHAELSGEFSVCPYDGADLELLAADKLIGSIFAERYEITSVLGKGGMSIVYKARHRLMERVVAIKLLHGHLVSDPSAVQRFKQEAQAASSLQHPNVITVFDFGIINESQAFLVMDCLEGTNLADIMEREGRLKPERAVRIFRQVCEGLDHAHRAGIVHRDLKPSNLCILEQNGKEVVKIVDFGIAKVLPQEGKQRQQLTQTGEIFGSPLFMSPEQCTGRQLDPRSDIYSLGCVMYEALTGSPPLMGETAFDTMTKHVNEFPLPPSRVAPDAHIPVALENIVMRCLEKEPDQRYQSALQVLADLPTVRDDTGSLKVTPVQPVRRQTALSKIAMKVYLAVAVVLAVIFAYAGLYPGPENDRATVLQKALWNFETSIAEQAMNSKNYQLAQQLLDQAESLSRSFGDNRSRLLQTLELKRKLFEQANMFEEQEKVSQAITLVQDERVLYQYEMALKKLESLGASTDGVSKSIKKLEAESMIPTLTRLCGVLSGAGFWAQEEKLLKRAIAVYGQLQGADSLGVAKCQVQLSDCYRSQQRTPEVRALLVSGIRILEKAKGENERETIEAVLKLGIFDRDQSQYASSKQLLDTALKRAQKFRSKDTRLVADCLNALADYYVQTGDKTQAAKLFSEAAAIRPSSAADK